ncbi:MAG: hypothetical protein LBG44_06080, partial [Gemmatimonadota bacterium]|nr:hypothetical protein [Gemmatimonadota bacterium]
WNNLLLDSLDAMPTTVNEERLNSEEAIVTFWAIEFVNTYPYECRYPIQPQAPFTLRDSILDAGLIPYP